MHVLLTLLAVEWLLMILLSYLFSEEQGTILIMRKALFLTSVCIHGVSVVSLTLFFLFDFLLLSVFLDPQTPTAVSACDNPTAWLQRDVTDYQLRWRLTAEKDELIRRLNEEKRSCYIEKEGTIRGE